jgi:hypothetical protein
MLDLAPSDRPAVWAAHAIRWGCLVLLALLTFRLFPIAGRLDVPLFAEGEIAPVEVIAPFGYDVRKSPEELGREAAALAATVPSIYAFRPGSLDSVLAETDSLVSRARRGLAGDTLGAALNGFGLRLTPSELAYLAERGRLVTLERSVRSFLRRQLARGVPLAGTLEMERGREVIVRREGVERFARRDTMLTYETFLESRWAAHPDPTSPIGDQVLVKLVNRLFRPTLEYDAAETTARRDELRATVDSVKYVVRAGERIVNANDPVTPAAHERLAALRSELLRQATPTGTTWAGILGQVLANGMLLSVFWLLVMLYRRAIYDNLRHVLVLTLMFAAVIVVAKLNLFFAVRSELIPIPFAAMAATVLFRGRVAMVGAMVLAVLIASQAAYGGVDAVFVAVVGGVAAAVSVRRLRHRRDLLTSVVWILAAYLFAEITIALRGGQSVGEMWIAAGWAAANTVVSAALVFFLLPLLEAAAGVTSDVTLLELSDPSRPLLRRLATEAPGTYAHSIAMANLCEAACDAIGGHGLLARVGCYYHDVGKVKKPQYFVENQTSGVNPHDKLKPDVSAGIIRNHVRDGVALAEEHNVPAVVRAFIPEHHGTMEIAYFLARARERDDHEELDLTEFRYPGPKPQSIETAVAMLADGVDAVIRVLDEPTPERLRDAIDHIISQRMDAGQLNDSPLTLVQLGRIRDVFVRVLGGAHHGRIDYPAAGGGISADWQGSAAPA